LALVTATLPNLGNPRSTVCELRSMPVVSKAAIRPC
jgi:hypothetical protein